MRASLFASFGWAALALASKCKPSSPAASSSVASVISAPSPSVSAASCDPPPSLGSNCAYVTDANEYTYTPSTAFAKISSPFCFCSGSCEIVDLDVGETATIQQTLGLPANPTSLTTYTVSFDYYVDFGAAGSSQWTVGDHVGTVPLTPAGEWLSYSDLFATGAPQALPFTLEFQGQLTVNIANLQVAACSANIH